MAKGVRLLTVFGIGANRFVLLIGPWAIKFARSARGLRAGRHERAVWKRYRGKPGNGDLLCPILASDPFGFMVIMRKAQRTPCPYWSTWLDRQPIWEECLRQNDSADLIGPEPKDWGVINGRFVLVDYSNVN